MDFTEATEFLSFFDWKELFLETRGLEQPDERNLFQYRVSDSEFKLLEDFLRSKIAALLVNNDFQYVGTRPGFPDLFVMYVAEWWRRRYKGLGFVWKPILSDLGVSSDDWTQQKRSDCVEEGLRGWGLRLSNTGGHTYIGNVAAQGGLPMQLLATAHGGIGRLISRVLRLAKTTSVSRPDLESWVQSLENLLPKSFRRPEIFSLISNITSTVLELKEKAKLTSEGDPITLLDQRVPEWRDRFPLPIEDAHAQALIEQLVKEAAYIRLEHRALVLPVDRTLEKDQNGNWLLRSGIELPDAISDRDISELFAIDSDEGLPRSAELSVHAGEELKVTSIRRLVGRNEYRVARTTWELSDEHAASEHLVRLTSPDGRVWSATPPRASELDAELPWLFSEEASQYRFARQGAGGVGSQAALVVIPVNWNLKGKDESGEIQRLGDLLAPARQVFLFRGDIVAQDGSGNTYRLKTGSAAGVDESYDWIGKHVWLDFQSPKVAFRGMPTLYIVDGDGMKRKAPGELRCSSIGLAKSMPLGPVQVHYPATGEIKHRSRMLLLPESSRLRLEPLDARSGKIIFDGWKSTLVATSTPEVKCESSRFGDSLVINVSVEGGTGTPDLIDFEVFWSHTPSPARVRIPFPAAGVRGFDRKGNELGCFSHLAVQELLGTRLVVMGTRPGSKVHLKLKAAEKDIVRTFAIKAVPDSLATEIRISDYRSEIDYLHTIDDNPDSTVISTIQIDGEPKYRLTILPYQVRPDRDDENVWIDLDPNRADDTAIASVEAFAVALERPGEESLKLQKLDSESCERVVWSFAPETREPGAWLIYPPKDAAIEFRPMLWTVGDPIESDSHYVLAMTTRDRTDRENAMDAFIETIASDFEDSGWTEVNQLIHHLGHLPLSTLDIWRRFAHSSKAMAALALRFSDFRGEFLSRFANELPFSWETVTFADWRTAVTLLERQVNTLFGPEQAPMIFKTFLKSRVADLTADFGSLFYLFGILQASHLEEERREAACLRGFGAAGAAARLFVGADAELQKLWHRHYSDDEEWPEAISDDVARARTNTKISKYLYQDNRGVSDGVINLPLILAARVALGETEEWFSDPKKLSLLYSHKSFDPDWFDEAFNLTIARCLADGLLDSSEE
ncbi:MAG: hypothetical protein IPM59_03355 [Chloracidobacterium sp.]|nr:hypothetical protein [Chloracidobacterium sp.]